MTLFCPIIHLVISKYQLLLSQKVTSLCPIISLTMIQNQLLLSQKNILFSPQICLNIYQILLFQKIILFSPKICLIMTMSTSPVPKSHLVMSNISSCYDSILTSPVSKVTSFCPIIRLVMTQYQLLLSQKVTLFVP